MVSYTAGSETEQNSAPEYPLGRAFSRKQQKGLASKLYPAVYSGDMSSPYLQRIAEIARSAGEKAVGAEREKIAGGGLTDPAKAEAYSKLQDLAIKSAVGAPIDVWKQALAVLIELWKPAGMRSSGSMSGGTGGGITYIPTGSSTPSKSPTG